jgi:hypothetical protein
MKRLPLLLLPLLAACTVPDREAEAPQPGGLAGIFQPPPPPGPVAPAPLPPQVVAALPPGVPQSVVQPGPGGCYLISIEVTDPPTGYPLRDTSGNPVCEGSTAPVAPIDPALLGGAPAAAPPAAATLPPAPVVSTVPLAPGNITPPAPIAPLDPT